MTSPVVADNLVSEPGRDGAPREHCRPGAATRTGCVRRTRGTVSRTARRPAASALDSLSARPAAPRIAADAPAPPVGKNATAESPHSAIRYPTQRRLPQSAMAHGPAQPAEGDQVIQRVQAVRPGLPQEDRGLRRRPDHDRRGTRHGHVHRGRVNPAAPGPRGGQLGFVLLLPGAGVVGGPHLRAGRRPDGRLASAAGLTSSTPGCCFMYVDS